MAITILDKKNCTGCEACCNICPRQCITLIEDEMGFRYPHVDHKRCIECKLCEKHCPVFNINKKQSGQEPIVYAARTKDADVRFHSTSGGMFSEFASRIIQQGGVVCGAGYNENNLVEHFLVDDARDIEKIRQSKYMQSRVGNVLQEIRAALEVGRLVAFCGTPCQVAGLHQYLGREYDNLLTIDFICRGVNSPKAFRYWLNELEQENHSKATKIWFKYKEGGWKASPRCTRVDFADGSNKVYSGKQNTFMCGYLGPNLYIRPSCGDCRFKGTPRLSDITLGDFWGLNSVLEDDGGTSLVMLNTPKGTMLFQEIRDRIEYEEHSFSEIAKGNVCADNSVTINPRSEEFLARLGSKPFSKLVKRYSGCNLPSKILRKSKKLFRKLIH